MMSQAELTAQRANTAAFIAANPTVLILIPRTRQKDGSGSRFVNGEPRAPQSLRLIDQSTSRNVIPGLVQTSDGRERLVDFMLLGPYNADIRRWDYWTDASGTWEVAEIYPDNQYEVRAAVVRHG